MRNTQKLTLALFIQAALISSTYASEQSEAKGFVEDAQGSVLFRTGFIQRDKKDGVKDTNSFAQTAMVKLDSGYTPGIVGFGVGAVGDASFKIGENDHSGNNMIPRDSNGEPYDHWTRGGGYVKARISNTNVVYGTQVLDIPVLASNTARLVPEYFTGVLATSREIQNLEVIAGKFTKNQFSDQISTDQNGLDRAVVWGAKYKFNDQLNASYYGTDVKDKLERHYINTNYKYPLAKDSSVTLDLSAYHTQFEPGTTYSSTVANPATQDTENTIWALSASYNQGPHNVMLAYQQNNGNVGYDYNNNADGGQSIYLPNSYLSDFIGNDEKSVQLQYNVDLGAYGVPGLSWTSAYVYGWDIKVKGLTDSADEQEFFNQVKYTVQSGFAKDASLRLRNSIYRASDEYQTNAYIGDTNEWRIFLDIPVKLF